MEKVTNSENIKSFLLQFSVASHDVIFIFARSKSRIFQFWCLDFWWWVVHGTISPFCVIPGSCTETRTAQLQTGAPDTPFALIPLIKSPGTDETTEPTAGPGLVGCILLSALQRQRAWSRRTGNNAFPYWGRSYPPQTFGVQQSLCQDWAQSCKQSTTVLSNSDSVSTLKVVSLIY